MPFDSIRPGEINNYIGKENIVIIDVRQAKDYAKGHIPTAINVPFEDIERYMCEKGKCVDIILYCERGNLSLLAARNLMKYGFNIKNLHGGICCYQGRLEKSKL